MYTAAELVTILAALGVFVAAIGSAVGGIVIALRNGQKIDQVHTLTNSNLSAVKAELAAATSEIKSLLTVVQDLKGEREKTAIAAALATPVGPLPVEIVPAEKPLPVEIVDEGRDGVR